MNDKIKKLLDQKNISQAELAENVGVSQAFISYMINGFKQPSITLLKRIADYLDVPVGYLIE